MQTISFLQTTPDQLQREINAVVRIILEDFLKKFKTKKRKKQLFRREKEKLAKAILSIVRIIIVIIHLTELSLIQIAHFETITFLLILAIIKTKLLKPH